MIRRLNWNSRTLQARLLLMATIMFAACTDPFIAEGNRLYIDVATGGEHTCAVDEAGDAYCWGRGLDGELGHGTSANSFDPVRAETDAKFTKITAGDAHTCALATDGRIFCWGWNVFYQLGDPEAPFGNKPSPVASDARFTDLSAGAHHTCAIATDERVFCWGNNRWGQNAVGTQNTVIQPEPIAAGLRAVSITSGDWHSCAVTRIGTAFCWGANDFGQLGAASDALFVTTPTAVVTNERFAEISAGATHTCGVSILRSSLCWGSNEYGELGDGAPFRHGLPSLATPTEIKFPIVVNSVAAGTDHTCAVSEGGLGYCWGRGEYGQLGNGSDVDRAVRDQIHLLPEHLHRDDKLHFSKIAAGGRFHTCGLAVEGSIYCWGTGRSGALGTSRNTFTSMPQRVPD